MLQELPPRQLFRAEAQEVRVRHLAVDERELPLIEALDEMPERDLGRFGPEMEHGLAAVDHADGDAVQPAGKLAVHEDLRRMRVAQLVQADIGLDHLLRDPGPALSLALRRRAVP